MTVAPHVPMMMPPSEEKEIPITITGMSRCTCHIIQERTLNGSVNVCISTWIREPVISQNTYDRLKSNGSENAVSEAEDLDEMIEMNTPMGLLEGRKKTKLTLYRGKGKQLPEHPGNQVTISCIIVTGIREEIDTILPRRYYNDMRLRFMRRIVGGGWKTLWGQLYIGQSNRENFHVYHTEEHDPLHDNLSDVWSFTRMHRLFNAFVSLVDKKGINYPLGFERPPENYEWFTTLLISAVRGSLYRDLRQLMKENPNWDLDPPAVHKRVAVPRRYNRNKWGRHGFIRSLGYRATALQSPEKHDNDISKSLSHSAPHQSSTNSIDKIMHRSNDADSLIDSYIWDYEATLLSLWDGIDGYTEAHPEVSSAFLRKFVAFLADRAARQ